MFTTTKTLSLIENLEGRRLFSAIASADLNHDGSVDTSDVATYDSSNKSNGFVQRYGTLVNALTDTSGAAITVR